MVENLLLALAIAALAGTVGMALKRPAMARRAALMIGIVALLVAAIGTAFWAGTLSVPPEGAKAMQAAMTATVIGIIAGLIWLWTWLRGR